MEEMEEVYFRMHVQLVQWVQRAFSAKVRSLRVLALLCGPSLG